MADELSPKEKWGIRELLSNEATRLFFLCGIIGSFYGMVVTPIAEIKNDLRQINENHLKHIEDAIVSINKRDDAQDGQLSDMCSKMDKFFGFFQGKYGVDPLKADPIK